MNAARALLAQLSIATFAMAASSSAFAAETGQSFAPLRALGLELLLLIPLAGLAIYLKRKKRSPKADSRSLIAFTPSQHLGDGVKAQIISVGSERMLLVHGKNGNVQLTPLAPEPLIPSNLDSLP